MEKKENKTASEENMNKSTTKTVATKLEAVPKVAVSITEDAKIWSEIKNLKLSMFALPAKPVHSFCTKAAVEPSKLYLTTTVSAFLPALEELLANKFDVDRAEKYIVVSRKKME